MLYRDHCERLKHGEFCLRLVELQRLQVQQQRALDFVANASRGEQPQQPQQQQQQQQQQLQQQQLLGQGQMVPGPISSSSLNVSSAQPAPSREAMLAAGIRDRMTAADLRPPPAKRIRTNAAGESPRSSMASPPSAVGDTPPALKSPGKGRAAAKAPAKSKPPPRRGKTAAAAAAASTSAATDKAIAATAPTPEATLPPVETEVNRLEQAREEADRDPVGFIQRSLDAAAAIPGLGGSREDLSNDVAGHIDTDSFIADIPPVVRDPPTSLTFSSDNTSDRSASPRSAASPAFAVGNPATPATAPPAKAGMKQNRLTKDDDLWAYIDLDVAGFDGVDDGDSQQQVVPPTPDLVRSSIKPGEGTSPDSDADLTEQREGVTKDVVAFGQNASMAATLFTASDEDAEGAGGAGGEYHGYVVARLSDYIGVPDLPPSSFWDDDKLMRTGQWALRSTAPV
jgi:hypothetical protein